MSQAKTPSNVIIDVFLVLSDGLRLCSRNASALFAILILCLGLAVTLSFGLSQVVLRYGSVSDDGTITFDALPGILFVATTALTVVVPWALVTFASMHICLEDLMQRKSDTVSALLTALKFLPRAIALSFIIGLILSLVTMPAALIVLFSETTLGVAPLLLMWPVFLVATIWGLAPVSMLAEHLNVWQALRRSAKLVKGNRWRVFVVVFAWSAFAGMMSHLTPESSVLLPLASGLFIVMFWSVLSVSLYGQFLRLFPWPGFSVRSASWAREMVDRDAQRN
jgi:hypothetical protein